MEIILFTVTAILLYVLADRVLDYIEVRRGARFQHRSIIFFFIILVLALGMFQVMQQLGGA